MLVREQFLNLHGIGLRMRAAPFVNSFVAPFVNLSSSAFLRTYAHLQEHPPDYLQRTGVLHNAHITKPVNQ